MKEKFKQMKLEVLECIFFSAEEMLATSFRLSYLQKQFLLAIKKCKNIPSFDNLSLHSNLIY